MMNEDKITFWFVVAWVASMLLSGAVLVFVLYLAWRLVEWVVTK